MKLILIYFISNYFFFIVFFRNNNCSSKKKDDNSYMKSISTENTSNKNDISPEILGKGNGKIKIGTPN